MHEVPPWAVAHYIKDRAVTAHSKLVLLGKIPRHPPAVQASVYPVLWFRMQYRYHHESGPKTYRVEVAYTATYRVEVAYTATYRRINRSRNEGWEWAILGHTLCLRRGVYRASLTYQGSELDMRQEPRRICFTVGKAKRHIVDVYESKLADKIDNALERSA